MTKDDEIDFLKAKLNHLREASYRVIEDEMAGSHNGTCHCAFCELLHALASSS